MTHLHIQQGIRPAKFLCIANDRQIFNQPVFACVKFKQIRRGLMSIYIDDPFKWVYYIRSRLEGFQTKMAG